ncbi:hypothetical protein NPIL_463331 [Nephila pilipes]|uniref:Uncharacterized protein n=1 Tax=Nephila pilipes TaxID=299642 RepID=A0A8X6NP02_NEPPI|nr:hypothetical protein NPIL_463331 [Nephila pilipes]
MYPFFLQCTRDEGDAGWKKIFANESWIYCYDPETKQKSTQWVEKSGVSPAKKEFKGHCFPSASDAVKPLEPVFKGSKCLLIRFQAAILLTMFLDSSDLFNIFKEDRKEIGQA